MSSGNLQNLEILRKITPHKYKKFKQFRAHYPRNCKRESANFHEYKDCPLPVQKFNKNQHPHNFAITHNFNCSLQKAPLPNKIPQDMRWVR